jgi:hypothetical protein
VKPLFGGAFFMPEAVCKNSSLVLMAFLYCFEQALFEAGKVTDIALFLPEKFRSPAIMGALSTCPMGLHSIQIRKGRQRRHKPAPLSLFVIK